MVNGVFEGSFTATRDHFGSFKGQISGQKSKFFLIHILSVVINSSFITFFAWPHFKYRTSDRTNFPVRSGRWLSAVLILSGFRLSRFCPNFRKKLSVVCLSVPLDKDERHSCPDFHRPCPSTSSQHRNHQSIRSTTYTFMRKWIFVSTHFRILINALRVGPASNSDSSLAKYLRCLIYPRNSRIFFE